MSNRVVGHDIIKLKGKFLPNVLVPLERLFSNHDTLHNCLSQLVEKNTLNCNISTMSDPKMEKLSKALPDEHWNMYVDLMNEFVDVFSWSYEDLNTFDTGIFQCKTPLKPATKPFKQKIIQFNPMLLHVIEKELKKLLDAKLLFL